MIIKVLAIWGILAITATGMSQKSRDSAGYFEMQKDIRKQFGVELSDSDTTEIVRLLFLTRIEGYQYQTSGSLEMSKWGSAARAYSQYMTHREFIPPFKQFWATSETQISTDHGRSGLLIAALGVNGELDPEVREIFKRYQDYDFEKMAASRFIRRRLYGSDERTNLDNARAKFHNYQARPSLNDDDLMDIDYLVGINPTLGKEFRDFLTTRVLTSKTYRPMHIIKTFDFVDKFDSLRITSETKILDDMGRRLVTLTETGDRPGVAVLFETSRDYAQAYRVIGECMKATDQMVRMRGLKLALKALQAAHKNGVRIQEVGQIRALFEEIASENDEVGMAARGAKQAFGSTLFSTNP